MGKYADIDALFESINRHNIEFADKVQKAINQRTSKALSDAFADFGQYQQERIREIFNDAVTSFYDSYQPSMYVRQGDTSSKTGGLYSVLDMKTDSDGWVISSAPDYDELYNPDKMHANRSGGNNLYQTVFVEGYHGGASSISGSKSAIWGSHPSPGTPYYRAPGWVKYPGESKKKWHKYGKWGRRSVHSLSPYRIISTNLSIAENGEMLDKLSQLVHEYNDRAVEEFMANDVPRIQKEVFG